MKRRYWILAAVAVLVAAGLSAYVLTRPEPNDTRFNGAYRLDDGRLAFITARRGEQLRLRFLDGESHILWPVGGASYEIGAGFSGREPVGQVTFPAATDGSPAGAGPADGDALVQMPRGSDAIRGVRLELPERTVTFRSGIVASARRAGCLPDPDRAEHLSTLLESEPPGRNIAFDGSRLLQKQAMLGLDGAPDVAPHHGFVSRQPRAHGPVRAHLDPSRPDGTTHTSLDNHGAVHGIARRAADIAVHLSTGPDRESGRLDVPRHVAIHLE